MIKPCLKAASLLFLSLPVGRPSCLNSGLMCVLLLGKTCAPSPGPGASPPGVGRFPQEPPQFVPPARLVAITRRPRREHHRTVGSLSHDDERQLIQMVREKVRPWGSRGHG